MITAVVFAAGLSSRMSGNKLLARIGNKTVIEHSVDNILASPVDKVIVVLGHEADKVRKALRNRPVTFVLNDEYSSGQSTSMQKGLAAVPSYTEAVLFCLGDQPLITPQIIEQLLVCYRQGGYFVVYPAYKGRRGNPVLFDRALFPRLLAVKGDRGGRSVIELAGERVAAVETSSPGVLLDIDTPADLAKVKAFYFTNGSAKI